MLIPVWSQYTIAELTGALLGFSFGIAADRGFNKAFTASLHFKSAMGQWIEQTIEEGYHHFFIGLALMFFASPYTSSDFGIFVYAGGLGLVVSEAKLIQKLLSEFLSSLSSIESEQSK